MSKWHGPLEFWGTLFRRKGGPAIWQIKYNLLQGQRDAHTGVMGVTRPNNKGHLGSVNAMTFIKP